MIRLRELLMSYYDEPDEEVSEEFHRMFKDYNLNNGSSSQVLSISLAVH